MGPLGEASSRKTLIYLILTLNHMYPDYDFSTLRAEHFHKEAPCTVHGDCAGAASGLRRPAPCWQHKAPEKAGRPEQGGSWAPRAHGR